MFLFSGTIRNSIRQHELNSYSISLLPQIMIPFLIGLFSGSFIGLFSEIPQTLLASIDLISSETGTYPFVFALWHACRFILVCLVFALWIPGFLMLPLLSALRAFVFSCSVAALVRPFSTAVFLKAFISFGIPALIELPGFFIASIDAFLFSGQMHSRKRITEQQIPNYNHLILIFLFCMIDACYMRFLLPQLIELLS